MEDIVIDENTYNDFFKTITSLQALAILFVMFTHWALAVELPKEFLWFAICYIGEFGFVIFIFLSGFLLNMKKTLEKNQKSLWGRWYKRRIIRIYPGLILSTLMLILAISLLYFTLSSYRNLNFYLIHISGFQSIPINPYFYSVNFVHWFITLIIVCYLFFPLFHYLIKKNVKIVLISAIILYINYVIFFDPFVDFSQKIVKITLYQDLNIFYYTLFVPNIFVLLFGMILGYWIGESNMENIEILRNSKIQMFSFVLLIILLILYLLILNFSLLGYARIIFYPLIGIVLIFFGISTFKNKDRFNKVLEFPGKNSYALILVHYIPLLINNYLILEYFKLKIIDYWYISIPFIIGSSFLLAIPVTYFGEFIKTHEKYHYSLILIVVSLIIYTAISLILILYYYIFLIYTFTIVIFLSILIIIILIFKKYGMREKILFENSNNQN